MNKVTYKDWVEMKQLLKEYDGCISDAWQDENCNFGRTTLQHVKKSKSFKQYKKLTNK